MWRKKLLHSVSATLLSGITLATLGGSATFAARRASVRPVTLTIGWGTQTLSQSPELEAWTQGFKRLHPNVRFSFLLKAQDPYKTTIQLDATTNSEPDIFWEAYPANAIPIVQEHAAVNLTPYLNRDPAWKNAFLPGALVKIHGNIYGVPYDDDIQGWWYNETMFKKYHLSIPTTWKQFTHAITVFKSHGITPIAWGAKDNWSTWQFNYFLVRFGFFQDKSKLLAGKMKFDNPEFVKGLSYLADLHKLGAFSPDASTTTYTQATAQFVAGKSPIFGDGSWDVSNLQKAKFPITFNWGPKLPGELPQDANVACRPTDNVIMVGNAAKAHLKLVLDFLKYIASSTGVRKEIIQGNDVPAVKVNTSQFNLTPLERLVYKELDNTKVRTVQQLPVQVPASMDNVYWNAVTSVALGVLSPTAALKTLDQWYSTTYK